MGEKEKDKRQRRLINKPCGIQVSRTESLLFLLLKAVLIPITIKYFLFPDDSPFFFISPDIGEPLTIDSCVALAAANSISKFDIVLSNVLHFFNVMSDASGNAQTIYKVRFFLLYGVMSLKYFTEYVLSCALYILLLQLKKNVFKRKNISIKTRSEIHSINIYLKNKS